MWSIAGAGMAGTPKGRSSVCKQQDKCPTLIWKSNVTQLLGVAKQGVHLPQVFFKPALFTCNPMGGHPTHLSAAGDSLLKRQIHMNTQKHQPAYSFSLDGTTPLLYF